MPATHKKLPKGAFVTGTDTGVGKTFVSIQLIHALKGKGIAVAPRKPVESGCQKVGLELRPADALAMQRAVGPTIPLDEICPYRLQRVLSPERAAVLEGKNLSLKLLETACRAPTGGFLLVEGAGGFYSPLATDGLVADLAQRLNLAVVLVSADRLGCINQILLNVQAIESRGLVLAAIILNQLSPQIDPEMDNLQDLRSRLNYPIFRIEPKSDPSNLTISPAIVQLTERLVNQ